MSDFDFIPEGQGSSTPSASFDFTPDKPNQYEEAINFERGSNYPPQGVTTLGPSINAAMAVQGAMGAPKLLMGLAKAGVSGADALMGYLQGAKSTAAAAKSAETMFPNSALEQGLQAESAKGSAIAARKALSTSLYNEIPKATSLSTPGLNDEASKILIEVGKLPAPDQSPKIMKMATAYKDLGQQNGTELGSLMQIRSNLKDLAYKGEGLEKLHATRLLGALQSDIEKGATALPPSAQNTQFASDLRKLWVDAAQEQTGGVGLDKSAAYLRPDVFQPTVPTITNQTQDALRLANVNYRQQAELANSPIAKAIERAKPEQYASTIFNKGNVMDAAQAKAYMGDVGYGKVQEQFFNQLLDSKNLSTKLEKYTPEFLNIALGPELTTMLRTAASHADMIKKAVFLGKTAAGVAGAGGLLHIGSKLAGQ